jgi:hypothetical protein
MRSYADWLSKWDTGDKLALRAEFEASPRLQVEFLLRGGWISGNTSPKPGARSRPHLGDACRIYPGGRATMPPPLFVWHEHAFDRPWRH